MASEQELQAWKKCLELFKDNLPEEQYDAWFAPLEYVSFVDTKLTLKAPTRYFIEQLEGQYANLITSVLNRIYGTWSLTFSYKIVSKPDVSVIETVPNQSPVITNPAITSAQQPANPFQRQEYPDLDPQLNSKYTFENYCGSSSNKLAVTVGMSIGSTIESMAFNPLFLFGPTGVGKTHLIQAIGIKIKENAPHARVLYVTARLFESQYTTAVKSNHVNDFINFYQSLDALIIDDIQEFAGKTGTQNTFFHIFNHLHQLKKKIILSSDTRPAEMDGMMPRLLSRFKWGMTVELERPDYTLRRDVLALKASQDGLTIPDDVLDFIAKNVTDSIRELEGIVVSLLAHSTMLNKEISIDLARNVIANSVKISKRQISFEHIVESVCSHYNIDSNIIYGKSRKREISDARQLIMYLAKKYTQQSSTHIGNQLSRNHATVLHSIKTIEERLSVEKEFQNEVNTIENEMKA